MSSFSLEELTIMVKAHFAPAFRHDDVNVLIVPHASGKTLLFSIKALSQNAYIKERTIFGKAIRLILYLNDHHFLLKKLKQLDINKVMVTEAPSPSLSNKENTSILDASFIEETLKQIATLRLAGNGVAETGIKVLIG